MDWTPGGMSNDVEDRRGSSGGFGMGGGGIGILGFIILLIISLVTGHNFIGSMLRGDDASNGSSNAPAAPPPAAESRDVQLISFVLDDAQNTWTQIFAEHHRTY